MIDRRWWLTPEVAQWRYDRACADLPGELHLWEMFHCTEFGQHLTTTAVVYDEAHGEEKEKTET